MRRAKKNSRYYLIKFYKLYINKIFHLICIEFTGFTARYIAHT